MSEISKFLHYANQALRNDPSGVFLHKYYDEERSEPPKTESKIILHLTFHRGKAR